MLYTELRTKVETFYISVYRVRYIVSRDKCCDFVKRYFIKMPNGTRPQLVPSEHFDKTHCIRITTLL